MEDKWPVKYETILLECDIPLYKLLKNKMVSCVDIVKCQLISEVLINDLLLWILKLSLDKKIFNAMNK